jgi:ribonuclease P protein component
VRPCARSEHFALHHFASAPLSELSTGDAPNHGISVDDSTLHTGIVVPKRHARRAVTRGVVKRQIRAALQRHRAQLKAGLWVIRLRSPFDPRRFHSAASVELRLAMRQELDRLFGELPQ